MSSDANEQTPLDAQLALVRIQLACSYHESTKHARKAQRNDQQASQAKLDTEREQALERKRREKAEDSEARRRALQDIADDRARLNPSQQTTAVDLAVDIRRLYFNDVAEERARERSIEREREETARARFDEQRQRAEDAKRREKAEDAEARRRVLQDIANDRARLHLPEFFEPADLAVEARRSGFLEIAQTRAQVRESESAREQAQRAEREAHRQRAEEDKRREKAEEADARRRVLQDIVEDRRRVRDFEQAEPSASVMHVRREQASNFELVQERRARAREAAEKAKAERRAQLELERLAAMKQRRLEKSADELARKAALELIEDDRKRRARKGAVRANTQTAVERLQDEMNKHKIAAQKLLLRINGEAVEISVEPDTTLLDIVNEVVRRDTSVRAGDVALSSDFPRRQFSRSQMSKTLQELGLLPRGVLRVSFTN